MLRSNSKQSGECMCRPYTICSLYYVGVEDPAADV